MADSARARKSRRIKHPAIRPRRVAVCGSSRLGEGNDEFCFALGRQLAREPGLVVVTGGFGHKRGCPQDVSADWCTVSALEKSLSRAGIPPERCIETLIPEIDSSHPVRFRTGKVVLLPNRSAQSRRFSLVSTTDATVTVEGSRGTKQIIDLALAIEKPVLPLPFTGGASLTRWRENRESIREWFRIPARTARRWEGTDTRWESGRGLAALARSVVRHLIPALQRRCLVVMPFSKDDAPLYDDAIAPAIADCGLASIRTDRLQLTGNAMDILRQSITSCEAAVVVVTGSNPNVMYELGLVHAHGKPALLLCKLDSRGKAPTLPFDILHENVVWYTDDMAQVRASVTSFLGQNFGDIPRGS